MKFSPELQFFLFQLHADTFDFGRNDEQVIRWALDGLDARQKQALKAFLVALLSRPVDLNDLQRQWRASKADVGFREASMIPHFLGKVRDAID